MSLFGDAWKKFGQGRGAQPTPQALSTGEEMSPYDPRFRLMDLTGAGDWLTMNDMFTGIAAFGAAGSGKTSSLATLAMVLMEIQCGFVWLCAKPDEVQLVHRLAAAAGRAADVEIIGLDINGELTPHRFNPLDYEANAPGAGTGAVVEYLSDCHKVLSMKEGERSKGGEDRFWQEQFERLLRYCIDTAKLAGRPLSVDLLQKIQLSGPTSPAQLAEDAWASQSTCWKCLIEAEARLDQGEIAEADFERILNFWQKDYAGLAMKTRSIIDVTFASLVDSFYAEEPLRSILTTTSTITPDDVINDGKIVVLSLPTNIFHGPGRMAQFTFKYSLQRAMLRRIKPADGAPVRPIVLWVDEAHAFAHRFDSQYFAEVRSNRGINVFLEQGVGGYMDALGVEHKEQVDRFLQNLATKFFFQNTSPLTNEFAADVIGKRLIKKGTVSWNQSHHSGATAGESETEEERYQVFPGEFSQLRRGGVENNLEVEFYVTKAGAVFRNTGANWARGHFQQTELTR
ncbi:MAG: hypothetical protein JOZ57_03435 [Abitibacteriaceae bacterium]|nr:hypothetical protein [Abditibacteriaceae bacterium]